MLRRICRAYFTGASPCGRLVAAIRVLSPLIFHLRTSGSRPVVAIVAVDCRAAAHLQAQLAYFPSCRGLILDRRSPCLQRCLRSSFIQQQVNAILKLVPHSLPRAPLCHKLVSKDYLKNPASSWRQKLPPTCKISDQPIKLHLFDRVASWTEVACNHSNFGNHSPSLSSPSPHVTFHSYFSSPPATFSYPIFRSLSHLPILSQHPHLSSITFTFSVSISDWHLHLQS